MHCDQGKHAARMIQVHSAKGKHKALWWTTCRKHSMGVKTRQQRSCACPISGSVQGQVGWGFKQSELVTDPPAHGRTLD